MKELDVDSILRHMQLRDMSKRQVAIKAGIAPATLGRILDGKIKNSGSISKIASALDVEVGALYKESDLIVYTLDTAPVCKESYYLELPGKDLMLPFLPEMPIQCVIVPWTEEAKRQAIRVIYRRSGQKRAFVATVDYIGDDLNLYPSASPRPEYLDQTDDQILGAIFDVVSLASFFRR